MIKIFSKNFKNSLTYQFLILFGKQLEFFFETLGNIGIRFALSMKYILTLRISVSQTIQQAKRFSIDSLPITLIIVGMTTIIITMQVAPELIKQGGGNYIGMLVGLVMIRELADIMSGFAIISMIGSAFASELATMKVTEQIDAMKTLKVDPIEYLFVPRLVSGFIMMPFVFIVCSFFGLLCGAITAMIIPDGITLLNFMESLRLGLSLRDINIAILKSCVFGFAIVLVSLSCGYSASGGAKGVGLATTKAVVWSFITIAIIDYIFALIFYF